MIRSPVQRKEGNHWVTSDISPMRKCLYWSLYNVWLLVLSQIRKYFIKCTTDVLGQEKTDFLFLEQFPGQALLPEVPQAHDSETVIS